MPTEKYLSSKVWEIIDGEAEDDLVEEVLEGAGVDLAEDDLVEVVPAENGNLSILFLLEIVCSCVEL